MAKKKTGENYEVAQGEHETLLQWYKRLQQTADKRLERAEKYSTQEFFKPAMKWAYAKAQQDIKRFNGAGSTKFGKTLPKTEAGIRSKINAMITYLQSPTSTKMGIISVYKKRADKINKNFGTKFTWQSLAKYFESGEAKKWEDKFGSRTALKTIAQLQKNKKEIIKKIEEEDKRDIRVEDKLINRTVNEALSDENLDIKSLF